MYTICSWQTHFWSSIEHWLTNTVDSLTVNFTYLWTGPNYEVFMIMTVTCTFYCSHLWWISSLFCNELRVLCVCVCVFIGKLHIYKYTMFDAEPANLTPSPKSSSNLCKSHDPPWPRLGWLGMWPPWGYRGGVPTVDRNWRPCPLWEPTPSHPRFLM